MWRSSGGPHADALPVFRFQLGSLRTSPLLLSRVTEAKPIAPTELPELVLEAGRSDAHYWRDLWRYRELLFFLAWRDVKVRYKQAALGAAWALVQPIVTMVLFTFVFGKLAGMPSGSVPYPLLVLAGLLPGDRITA